LPSVGTDKTVLHASGGKIIEITGHLSTGDLLPYFNYATEVKLCSTPNNIIIKTEAWEFSSPLATEVSATVRILYVKN
jgi:hypothetical protein